MNRFAGLLIALVGIQAVCAQSVGAGKKLFDERKYEEARKTLAAVAHAASDYAEAQYYLGRIAFEQKRFDDAIDFFEAALKKNDRVAAYHEWYGNALGSEAQEANVMRQGMLAPRMKAAWEKAVQLDPQTVGARQSLIEYYMQAPGFMGGSKEKAEEVAKEVIALDAARGHLLLGGVYARQNKVAEAEKAYREAARFNPQFSGALSTFYVNRQLYEKAFALFDEAIKKNPDDMLALYQMGRTSALSGQRLDQGESALKKYLQHTPQPNAPGHDGANMRLGQIYEKKGNRALAKTHYQQALKLDASLKEAKEGLARVSK